MKKVWVLFLMVFIMNCTQTNKDHEYISNLLIEHYNSENYESIFSSFSNEMKTALPLEQTREFFTSLKHESGDILKKEFMNYEKTYAAYKTYFERNVFVLLVSIDSKSKINGLFIRPLVEDNHPIIERNTTEIALPFKDEWFVFWGGDTEELNYHVVDRAQKNAFDFIIIDNEGKSYKKDGSTNEDYYAYGKKITVPCDGEVVLVVDGIKDNVPGKLNPIYVPGNTVIIRAINGEYIVLAHFKQYSIEVKQGQNVKQGDLIGLCGNSGNSSEAHLHLHLQNVENMNEATGIKCYFGEITVNSQRMINYSPLKGEKVRRE